MGKWEKTKSSQTICKMLLPKGCYKNNYKDEINVQIILKRSKIRNPITILIKATTTHPVTDTQSSNIHDNIAREDIIREYIRSLKLRKICWRTMSRFFSPLVLVAVDQKCFQRFDIERSALSVSSGASRICVKRQLFSPPFYRVNAGHFSLKERLKIEWSSVW